LTELLLRPGVTTATAPNQLAGRGIGLDLVSNSVARLKGELRISAEAGKGTTVEIRVPSSISSAALLMVQAGGKSIGIPLDALRRTISLATLPKLAERYLLDGRPLALVSLAQVLKSQTMDSGAGFHPDLPASIALEIEAPPNSFLLGIDRLLSIEQTIIQSLPDHILAEPFVLGASIGPSGEPRLILDPMILAASLDEQMAGPASGADRPAPSLPILVIDDSLTTRMLEQSILETAGYAVELAASAEEGLELARQRRYGLFLVDVEMPGMNGFAFIEKYRQEPALSQIPAILVSSRSSDEDRSRGRDAGAKDYIVKGEFDQRYLLKRVRDLMSAR
jgi:two-component system chemotaxis sensor kinase CheA